MKILVEGYDINLITAEGPCSGYDTPGCGSYCGCLCNGDR